MDERRISVRHTGAVYTPTEVATAIVERCSSLLGASRLNVLEPSVGDGAFLSGLTGIEGLSVRVTAIDVDEEVILELKHRYHNQTDALSFVAGDFVQYAIDRLDEGSSDEKFNLIVGNPPFIRRHNFSDGLRESVDRFACAYDYPLSRLKNTWPAFLVASAKLVSDDGVVALVLPYEVLTVDYGQKVLNYIQNDFERVDIFVSTQKAFPEIDQDAILLIAQKKPQKGSGLYISKVTDFGNLSDRGARKVQFKNGTQGGLELNSYLLPKRAISLVKELQSKAGLVSHYVSSAPGIVSAANDFFIRTKADTLDLGLSAYAKPILKKGSFSSVRPTFTSADFDDLAEREPCYLLHFSGEREDLSAAATSYVEMGEERELHLRYKCRNRPRWYEVPLVEPEQAFIFKRSHSHPRVILNEAGVHTTDTAYGLRLEEGFSARGFCFSFYTSLTMFFAEVNGRFYGGGVLELSPKEFRSLALFYHEPTNEEFDEFVHVHLAANGNIEEILDFGDKWLIRGGHMSESELAVVRKSWRTIRAHRLRHGGRQAAS